MAQSLATIPYVGEAGGLREWPTPAHAGEIPSMEIWSWTPVAPTRPEPQVRANPGAAPKITQVLAAWRAAEHLLQDLLEASPMRTLARSEVARLRAEYQRLFAQAIR
jgi:hypothetical protein